MTARKISYLRPLLLAATLAIGFGTLWSALVTWLGTSLEQAWRGEKEPPYERLVVSSPGTPLIESTPRDNLSQASYRDLTGQVHDAPDPDEILLGATLAGEPGTPGFLESSLGWEQRLRTFMDEREPTANWFFVHDGKPQGSGYFAGYERVSNRLIGYIGLSGFRSHSVPAEERIPVPGYLAVGWSNWSSAPFYLGRRWAIRPERWDLPPRLVHVPDEHLLRQVDLAARTVTTVFETPEHIESVGIPWVSSSSAGHVKKEQPILVRTSQKIYALDHEHNVTRTFTIPTEIDRQSSVTWYAIDNGEAIAHSDRPSLVYRIAAEGAILERLKVSIHTGSGVSNETQAFLLALALPVPALVLPIEPGTRMRADQGWSYGAAVRSTPISSLTALAAVLALASVLAVITWRRSRQFGVSRRMQIAWTLFVALFGVPSFVGYLLHRRWPVREPCPSCHEQAARDRAACSHCGTRFPEPALKGIEIFA